MRGGNINTTNHAAIPTLSSWKPAMNTSAAKDKSAPTQTYSNHAARHTRRNMSKYGNKQSAASDGKVFASRRERRRYEELCLLEKMGKIRDLECQVKYELIPAQKMDEGTERAVTYTLDFRYADTDTGRVHHEDAKGAKTQQYVIRRKLMLWIHQIRIEEL
jgi:hypothetical protein